MGKTLLKDDFLDFVLVGAPRCGTTWLSDMLRHHPDVYIPETKELRFFGQPVFDQMEFRYDRGMDFFRSFFAEAPEAAIKGELTPTYYIDETSAARIHKHFPRAKILFQFRNPADMMHSMYLRIQRHMPTAATFEEELETNPEMWELARYHHYAKFYTDVFERDQIKFSIYEEIFADLDAAFSDIYAFIGADPDFRPPEPEKKVLGSGRVRSRTIAQINHSLLAFMSKPALQPLKKFLSKNHAITKAHDYLMNKNIVHGNAPKISPETRKMIVERCLEETERLETFLQKDLTVWKS